MNIKRTCKWIKQKHVGIDGVLVFLIRKQSERISAIYLKHRAEKIEFDVKPMFFYSFYHVLHIYMFLKKTI